MELNNIRNLIKGGGVELIKAQLKAAIASRDIIEIISDGRFIIGFDSRKPECGIINDNFDELRQIPGIEVRISAAHASIAFDYNSNIDEWEPYMVERFEENVVYHTIYEADKFYIGHSSPLEISFIDYLERKGFIIEDNSDYSMISAN